MKQSKTQDIVVGITLVVLALLGMFVLIPIGVVMPEGIDNRALAPTFWPLIITIGLALSGAVLVVQGIMKGPRDRAAGADQPVQVGDGAFVELGVDLPLGIQLAKVGAAVVALFVYYFAIQYIGMVAASVVAVVFFMLLGGERRLQVIVPIALILPVVLYYFFTQIANVPLPLGVFENWR